MIISRTPVRISFFGGGTDYPAYFRRHGGETLVTSVNKFLTVSVQHLTLFSNHRIQVHYSKVESVGSVDEIQLPVVRETLRFLNIDGGLELHLAADLPARTGIGSSSAATVGLLTALHAYRGEMVDLRQIASEAVFIEQEMIRERVGCQDQYACAVGGFQHLEFCADGKVHVRPVTISKRRLEQLQERLLLFYTGIQRTAHEVIASQIERTANGVLDDYLLRMRGQVRDAISILANDGPLSAFGQLLAEAWTLKRKLSDQISNSYIDEMYTRARVAGALGGKLLGAGAGGFLLLFVEPEMQSSVRAAVAEMREVRFSFEQQGSRIVFFQPS